MDTFWINLRDEGHGRRDRIGPYCDGAWSHSGRDAKQAQRGPPQHVPSGRPSSEEVSSGGTAIASGTGAAEEIINPRDSAQKRRELGMGRFWPDRTVHRPDETLE